MQASRTLVWVICHCLKAGVEGQIGGPTAQAIANSFEQHYNRIQHCHDFGEYFPVYLAYDIYIRHAYLQSGGICSVHDWHKLGFEKKLQDFMIDNIRHTLNQPSDLLFGDGSLHLLRNSTETFIPFVRHHRKRRRLGVQATSHAEASAELDVSLSKITPEITCRKSSNVWCADPRIIISEVKLI